MRPNPVVAERIKELRVSRGLSVREFAEKIGVWHSRLYEWEQLQSQPKASHVIKICATFGVSADYILGTEKEATRGSRKAK